MLRRLVPPAIRALVGPSGEWPVRHETRRVRRDQPGFGCLERVEARTGRRAAACMAADPPVRIPVFDNQIEPALKSLKREMLKDGLFKEMKLRAFYEKPSVKRKRKQAAARRKRRKALARLERSSVD
jgi:small subunit ribosomal protein S21